MEKKTDFRVKVSINLSNASFFRFLKVLWYQHDMGRLDIDDLHDSLYSTGVSGQLDSR